MVTNNGAGQVPVFYDPAGRRWRRVRRTWLALAVFVTALTAIFIASVLVNPLLPHLNLRPIAALPHPKDINPKPLNLIANPAEQKAKRAREELQRAIAGTKRVIPSQRANQTAPVPPPSIPLPAAPTTRPLAIGFYVNWDESSYASLKRNLDQLDWVIPGWAALQDGDNPLATDVDIPALNLIRGTRPQTRIIPMVQNLSNDKWNSELLARWVGDEQSRRRLIGALDTFVEDNKFGGICVDFEELPPQSQPNLLLFMQELHAQFAAKNLVIVQAVPFDNPDWHYRDYAAASDYLVLMAYDQHWAAKESGTGPVAGQDWYQRILVDRMKDLDPHKTIIAIGSYGYDWTAGVGEAKEVTFQEAVISARDSQADIAFDPTSENPYFQYTEEDNSDHTVWFLDAVTAYNQMRAASGYGCAGFAVWRLGSEDPSIWSILGAGHTNYSVSDLRRIIYGYSVDFEGTGELLEVVSRPQDGERDVKVDPKTGFIGAENYLSIPTSYVIQRVGDHPGEIALTFDDGPDPEWTPAILDILKQENVPATFFIIGKNGQAHPELLRRLVNEGHEVGNHTFTHPNLGEVPGPLTDLELNATQRLIESITGRSTVLFRPPYFGDAEADKPDEVEPAFRAQQLGYLMVGLRIDPDDWQLPVTANDIISRTLQRAQDTNPETRG
ncbi:MAG TPA: polysaccharide deacetylase family protein, partial [Pyrinomonadaceae bacterium]